MQHLLEDLEIAEERGGRRRVAVQARGVGIGLKRGDAVGQGGVGRVGVPWRLVRTVSLMAVWTSAGRRYQNARKKA